MYFIVKLAYQLLILLINDCAKTNSMGKTNAIIMGNPSRPQIPITWGTFQNCKAHLLTLINLFVYTLTSVNPYNSYKCTFYLYLDKTIRSFLNDGHFTKHKLL